MEGRKRQRKEKTARAVSRRPRGLYVKNIPSTMNAESLRRLFSEFGRVESVVMGRVRADSPKPPWAIVNPHSTRDGLEMLSALNRRPPLCLSVSPAISPEEKRRQNREREEEQRFFEEVRREALAARSKDVTPVNKADRDDLNTTITTSASDITTTTTTSVPQSTTTTITTTTETSSTIPHNKISQTPFEVSHGIVEVPYRPAEPCVRCGVSGRMVCSVCGAWYCGKVCQEAHWALHEDSCAVANPSPLAGIDDSPSPVSPEVPECFTTD